MILLVIERMMSVRVLFSGLTLDRYLETDSIANNSIEVEQYGKSSVGRGMYSLWLSSLLSR